MKTIRVLVTGAGSGVGQGIMKALRVADLPIWLIAADIQPMNCGLYRADEAVLVPPVEQPGALDQLITVIRQLRTDVVLLGSEYDLTFISQYRERIEQETGALVPVSPPATVAIADDKWLTAEFLRTHGLPYAEAALPSDLAAAQHTARRWGYPLVLKTRRGTASRHVHVVEHEAALSQLFPVTPNPMLQRQIAAPRNELSREYTCSVFKGRDGRLLGPFCARRTLRGGSSWVVEVAPFPELTSLLMDIGSQLAAVGSLNVQLMKDGAGNGVPFEVNARFSGTTAIRAHFGFNEPAMVIRDYLLGERLATPTIRRGVALRYLEEVFVDDVAADDLHPPFPKGHVRNWF